jgi:FAD/FMN-containing dehydrogenase
MMLKEANQAFLKHGLALENLGDVDLQALAGAIGTGTHGTGRRLRILSNHLVGGRLVNGKGEVVEFSLESDRDFTLAARVSMGSIGIFTELRLRLVPAFKLHRREWCTHIDDCMANLDHLVESNRNFDFYWYPRSDEAKLRTLNPPGEGPEDIPYAWCQKEKTGWSGDVIPRDRDNKFDEIEFWLPAENGPACFEEVRQRIKESTERRWAGGSSTARLPETKRSSAAPMAGTRQPSPCTTTPPCPMSSSSGMSSRSCSSTVEDPIGGRNTFARLTIFGPCTRSGTCSRRYGAPWIPTACSSTPICGPSSGKRRR